MPPTDTNHGAARLKVMQAAFRSCFGREPRQGARSPGRVDLMGSHTDYNDGLVLTLPIDRDTWILASPRQDRQLQVHSLNLNDTATCPAAPDDDDRTEGWAAYIQGVLVTLADAGYPVTGFDGVVHGTVPLGSGLSSSASLEAAVATLMEALSGFRLDPVEKARLCQRAENEWVGMNCGILDQYSSILGKQGKALVLDCRSLTHTYAEFPAELRLVICNTCAPRRLTGSEYGERRAQCELGAAFFANPDAGVTALRDVTLEQFELQERELPALAARRSRFIIEENARVTTLAEALRRNDRAAIAGTTDASYTGARDLFEIGVPVMESMYRAMKEAPGCVGCRQAGAGFGGCMVAFVERDRVESFCSATADSYRETSGIAPAIYPIRTAPGASVLEGLTGWFHPADSGEWVRDATGE